MKGLALGPARTEPASNQSPIIWLFSIFFVVSSLFLWISDYELNVTIRPFSSHSSPLNSTEKEFILNRCRYARATPGPPPGFQSRKISDRFVQGTPAVLIRNATIWNGLRNGTEVIEGDVLLDGGVVKALGYVPDALLDDLQGNLVIENANGAWVTPGIVDLHSHIAAAPSPGLSGAQDTNSRKSPINPWLRIVDGLNTHDDTYELSIAGGVTSVQVLPGSANSIGGLGAFIKLRQTPERTTFSKLLEPPYELNGTHFDHTLTPRWRHMKHACGENPRRVYSQNRMDSAWGFREAYDSARKIKEAQDAYCDAAEAGSWKSLGTWPESLQWEHLIDVLRGKVKLSVHCYEAVDLDMIVRLTNEFQFPVASFHHAGETYLVPDRLKQAWGGAPAIALFASNFRKKREAYRGSEFAPRILSEHGIPVVMKSDHPVINSRLLQNEAALAHYFGLHPALALSSITSTPADAAGLGHRIGRISEGYDADLVIWDSHPLSLGATPKQVFIDGIAQLKNPHVSHKPASFQKYPRPPNFDKEAAEAIKYEGLPPLKPSRKEGRIAFVNVRSFYDRSEGEVLELISLPEGGVTEVDAKTGGEVIVESGEIICYGSERGSCLSPNSLYDEIVDLTGGSISPALITFGTSLGLSEIRLEPVTNDGPVYDPFIGNGVPSVLKDRVIAASDGLQFGGRNTLLAYRGGVTTAISSPSGSFLRGISTAFNTGADHALEPGAIVKDAVALHVSVSPHFGPSVSSQIAALKTLLLDDPVREWKDVLEGVLPLIVHTDNADIMASIIRLKAYVEAETGSKLLISFAGAQEAHLIAKEIGEARVGVIIYPVSPFPHYWDGRRILPGPPITRLTAIVKLLQNNVTVAIGVTDEYLARHTGFELTRAVLETDGFINKKQALSLVTTNIEKLFGLEAGSDLVAYRGGEYSDLSGVPVAILSKKGGFVDLM
ncbi:carbohydrate esterase family 9 protein [Sistotremastrum niveocremeum HHB9708]|uniref:Carbohydrate esterase family 9 protein n=1 Tax=Sistotremastrum niveocremeum HHB9708 TaxID=1314777 RepID=A0A164MHV4_9AGAM|nr:carbohydrate esterase family 9 protein [Sistotremastrum niveocremeum HHB9708]